MSLTSSSTYDDAMAQLSNNLSWEGSATKAAAALEAVRWLMFNRAQASTRQGSGITFEKLESLEKRLADYVASSSTTARANRSPFVRGIPL